MGSFFMEFDATDKRHNLLVRWGCKPKLAQTQEYWHVQIFSISLLQKVVLAFSMLVGPIRSKEPEHSLSSKH